MRKKTRTKIRVLDAETNIKNSGEDAVGDQKSAPWHPENKIVYLGYKDQGSNVRVLKREKEIQHLPFNDVKLLVGQNLKFDLHYLRNEAREQGSKEGEEFDEFLVEGRIWDTMLVEYLLTGQRSKMPSLNTLSEKYGGTLKDDRIKEYWNSGIDTEDIPEEEIVPYLENDVLNTETVFQAQAKKAAEYGMERLVMLENAAMMATAEMEYNGMCFDREYAWKMIQDLSQESQELEKELHEVFQRYITKTEVNINSTQQLSLVLFGGEYKYQDHVPVLKDGEPVRFKTGKRAGQIKTKKQEFTERTRGLGIPPDPAWKNKNGWYNTNDDVLTALGNKHSIDFLDKLLRYRDVSKQLNTYYKGCYDLVWPDGCIHHTLNHCITKTSRLSSTKPNSQNFTGKD